MKNIHLLLDILFNPFLVDENKKMVQMSVLPKFVLTTKRKNIGQQHSLLESRLVNAKLIFI